VEYRWEDCKNFSQYGVPQVLDVEYLKNKVMVTAVVQIFYISLWPSMKRLRSLM
jgi:hypothetical protein